MACYYPKPLARQFLVELSMHQRLKRMWTRMTIMGGYAFKKYGKPSTAARRMCV